MFSRWWSRLWGPPPLAGVEVIVYTRSSCPLCDEAIHFLQREQRRLGYSLRLVDIEGDSDLTHAYGEWIPVVAVAGKVRFRGRIDPFLWRRLIDALSRSA